MVVVGDVGMAEIHLFHKNLSFPPSFSYDYSPFAKLGPLKAFTNLERCVCVLINEGLCQKICPQNLLQAIRVTGRILLF